MIDHISVAVSDLERSARFYELALAPLGLSRLVTRPATVGFGKNYPEFWINLRGGMSPVALESGSHNLSSGKIGRRRRRVPRGGAECRRFLRRRAGPAAARSRALLRGVHQRSRRQSDRGGDVSSRRRGNAGVTLATYYRRRAISGAISAVPSSARAAAACNRGRISSTRSAVRISTARLCRMN